MHPIKDYYITGDLHSAALITRTGALEWLCFPDFDSPSVFASILDEKAGSFEIEIPEYGSRSDYVENTGIIEFTFTFKEKEFKVHDFMVPQEIKVCNNHFFVRKLIGVKGTQKIKLHYNPKPDYARSDADILQTNSTLQIFIEENLLILHFPHSCEVKKRSTGYELTVELKEGEEKIFVLEYILNKNNPGYKGQDLEKTTKDYWEAWVKKGHYFNYYRHQLIRSMITLKMMQFYPTGAFVAAPTTSLPEEIGGMRNWDYRFVWIRDATFTLYAFHIADYTEEAEGFFKFIQEIARKHKQKEFEINTVYTIRGNKAPTEIELNLKGYKNSSPVRAGNDATNQFQLDVYGSLIDAHYFMAENQKDSVILDKDAIMALVRKIESKWMDTDRGIWEVRSRQNHNTYSKVMCWVGIDRTLRMKEYLGLSRNEIDELEELRSKIYNWIWENCYDSSRENLMQFAGSEEVDATNFLLVLLQFLDKHDDITKKIIENTYTQLKENKIFIYRYHSEDGLRGKEGTFVLCIYWYISALAIMGNVEKSSNVFRDFEKYMSRTELLPEQIDSDSGEYLGNYPQAFSHLGLVMSIYYLDRYSKNA